MAASRSSTTRNNNNNNSNNNNNESNSGSGSSGSHDDPVIIKTAQQHNKYVLILICIVFVVITTIYSESDHMPSLSSANSISLYYSSNTTSGTSVSGDTITDAITDVSSSSSSSLSSIVTTINTNTNTTKTETETKKKKFILIHIGPSKTGTTSIQKDSGQNKDFQTALQLDKVVYIGKYADRSKRLPFTNSYRCMKLHFTSNITYTHYTSIADDNNTNNEVMKLKRRQQQRQDMIDTCWSKNKYILDSSIVGSDEGYSYKGGTEFTDKIQDFYKVFIDYFDYDEIIIVGAYRRYYDWLPSTYKEEMRKFCLSYNLQYTMNPNSTSDKDSTRNKACKSVWKYISGYINKGIKNFSTDPYRNIHVTLPLAREVLKELSSTNSTTSSNNRTSNNNSNSNNNNTHRVETLNYFQLKPNEKYYNTITTELYCKILGNSYTPNTCEYSRYAKAIVSNKGSLDNMPYKLIIHEAQKRNWITGFPKDYKRIEKFINTTIIPIQNISPTSTSKGGGNNPIVYTWEDLQEYHKLIMINNNTTGSNKNKNNNNTMNILGQFLPLVCPSKDKLEEFLKKSLSFEEQIMPKSFILSELGEKKHSIDFWNLADSGAYCYIDIPKLFDGGNGNVNIQTWDQFLDERMTITSW